MKGQFRFLSRPAPWLIYAGVFFGQASVYCWMSYISPIMTRVTGFSNYDMTYIMVIVGAGMVFGNYIAGRLADRFPSSLVTAVIQIAFNVSNAMAAAIGGAAIHHGFGLASPALAGTPLALISAAALFTLYHMERSSGKSGASGSDD